MLSKILGNWLNKTSKNDEEARINNLPKHEQAQLALEKLAGRRGRPFNPIKASSVQLQCVNTDILSLIERIDFYTGKIELSQSLTPKDCFAEVKTVTLDQFFTDTEGMYIPLGAMDTFVQSSHRLFAVINRGLELRNQDLEYSLRLMGKCFSSIQNVCKAVEKAE